MTSSTGDDSEAKTRDFAAWFVTYFEPLAAKSQADSWRQGLAAAREWLRLIGATGVSAEEVSSLVGIAHANVYRGSGWHDMACRIRRWAEDHGYQVPSLEEFVDRAAWQRRNPPPRKWWEFWK
jgi:hypothetical protein